MTVMVPISEETKAKAEELVRVGLFESLDDAIAAGLDQLRNPAWDDGPIDLDDLPPHVRAAVEEGLADIEAGRVRDGHEVFNELIARYEAMALEREQAEARER